jgi:hypothetical protein
MDETGLTLEVPCSKLLWRGARFAKWLRLRSAKTSLAHRWQPPSAVESYFAIDCAAIHPVVHAA